MGAWPSVAINSIARSSFPKHTQLAWVGRDRIFAEPKLYEPLGTGALIREQSRQRFGRSRGVIERQRRIRF